MMHQPQSFRRSPISGFQDKDQIHLSLDPRAKISLQTDPSGRERDGGAVLERYRSLRNDGWESK